MKDLFSYKNLDVLGHTIAVLIPDTSSKTEAGIILSEAMKKENQKDSYMIIVGLGELVNSKNTYGEEIKELKLGDKVIVRPTGAPQKTVKEGILFFLERHDIVALYKEVV